MSPVAAARRTAPVWLSAALAVVVGCAPAPESPGPWPQWRGPGSNGVVGEGVLPVTWSAEEGANILWRLDLPGEGNSSPIVTSGRIFLTSARKVGETEVERLVVAADLGSGELLWQTAVATDRREPISPHNTHAAPTPATDGRAVYAFFGGVLAAVDLEGRLLWTQQVDPLYAEESHYGAASSPLVVGDVVIAARDRETTHGLGWLAGFDRARGEELWRVTWDHTCCSYATPFPLERPGGAEVLFVHAGEIVAYDPKTGEKLWKLNLPFNQPVTGPVAEGDLLWIFSGADRVRHGAAVRLSGSGSATRAEILWESSKLIPQASSPVQYDGRLYTVTDVGALVCYDALTGRLLWRYRLPRGGYRASLLAGDGKIYVHNSLGTTTVLAAEGQGPRLLAQNSVAEPGSASPAWADPCLLLRSDSTLFCIGGGAAAP